ncbi:MAG: glycosyltransferase [Xenococcaceae cyanobacterium MO_167.B52]|nr:glycosyltransferase [Xenococcaceae cyanobacterium MO_167.B52]
MQNQDPQVTLVVVPRERFSFTAESLENIYENTDFPFKLIYVDGNSPAQVKRYLEAQAQDKKFQLVRKDYYLSPNHARNIGLHYVNTKYLVFIDNDVVVSPGWLKHLVQCAEETDAAVVGPLTCQNTPVHEVIHYAGGKANVWLESKDNLTIRRVRGQKTYKQGQQVATVHPQLQRQQTELLEFHCVLVRTEIFKQIGLLDEAMLATKEHVDFYLTVAQAGGSVYFEPSSIITFKTHEVPGSFNEGPPLEWSDIPFYMLRWSDAWEKSSLEHFRHKWNLTNDDGYFKSRYKKIGWRRKVTLIRTLSSKLTFVRNSKRLEKILFLIEKLLNRYLSYHYAQRQS